MNTQKNNTKLAQYDEFFSIDYAFSINVSPLTSSQIVNYDDFIQQMPVSFKMASDIEKLNQGSIKSTNSSSELSLQVINLLNLQSQKIDLLMNFILCQQDDINFRHQATAFGGGGLSFMSETAFALEQFLAVKIFMPHIHCAIFCYGQVIDVAPSNNNETSGYVHKVVFHYIRESDRESLVRYSLKEQSKQLQSLSKKRNEKAESNKA